MFTGLIECLGTIISTRKSGSSVHLVIKPDISDFLVTVGGSVAVDGSCLTLEKHSGSLLHFSAARETIERTTLRTVISGRRVNLERALKVGDRLDGHMVLGHVDGIGTIISDTDVGGSILRTVRIPQSLDQFMAEKGSISIDGISLTIARSGNCEITVSLIPITMCNSSMGIKNTGDLVNLECDVLARYIGRFLNRGVQDNTQQEIVNSSLLRTMERSGF